MSKKTVTDDAAEVEISDEAKAAAEENQGEAEQDLSLEAQLIDAKEKVAANHDRYMRAVAELENYRKRATRERQDLLKFGNENLLRDFLPVIDNLERAVEHAKENEADTSGLLEGVDMTLVQFRQVLDRFGVTSIDAMKQPFDPARHEAIGQTADESVPPNTVIQVMQKGYTLNDRLLRPAMVMVSTAPVDPAANNDTEETDLHK